MWNLALVLVGWFGSFGPSLQDPKPIQEGAALTEASPEARALWARLCAASGSPTRAPISAFQLKADVVTRSGVQTNEMHVDYRYLAPDCIRFMLPSKNETGRFGPAPEQYWLKSGDQVTVVAGREYKEDRRQVDDMLVLARNYVALSNPSRLALARLELLGAAPADLGPELAKNTKKLRWLALESADFALVRREGTPGAGTLYRVEVGLSQDDLPAVVIIRERGPTAKSEPMLVELGKYQERDGFKMPFQLLVHVVDHALVPAAFAERASQEIYPTEALLRPQLSVEDFQPRR